MLPRGLQFTGTEILAPGPPGIQTQRASGGCNNIGHVMACSWDFLRSNHVRSMFRFCLAILQGQCLILFVDHQVLKINM